jgi:hypothetical protein
MKRYQILLGICLAVIFWLTVLFSNNKIIKNDEIPGIYEYTTINKSSAVEVQIIDIRKDGYYTNTFIKYGRVIWYHYGAWSFELLPSEDEEGVELKRFRIELNNHRISNGTWLVEPKRYMSTIVICFSEPGSHNFCFKKKT